MRLFVAVEPDAAARLTLSRTIDALRDRLGRARVRLSIRWVPAEHLHVTLVFIGHVPDDAASAWIDAVRAPLAAAPFDANLAACGAFPPTSAPRVLWAGLDEAARAPLGRLRDLLEARLMPLGHVPEARPFSAHVTLARVKDVPRGEGARVRAALAAIDPPHARFHVDHVTLFRSHVSSAGARYEALERIPLVVR
jgi:2'-5' RNA ligase